MKLAYPRVVEVRASLPADRSFTTYAGRARPRDRSASAGGHGLLLVAGMLDVLFEYPIQSERSRFSIEPRLGRLGLRTLTVVRYPAAGRRHPRVRAPWRSRRRAARSALALRRWGSSSGSDSRDVVDGVDTLLFLACLVMPFRRIGPIVAVVVAFTVAHSITLLASAYSLAPDVLVVSAAHRHGDRAVDRLHGAREHRVAAAQTAVDDHVRVRARPTGFVFSFALRNDAAVRRARTCVTSLLSFNIGVELAQVLVLAVLVPVFAISLPVRRRGAAGNDHPVGVRRAHVVALAHDALRAAAAVPISVAGD